MEVNFHSSVVHKDCLKQTAYGAINTYVTEENVLYLHSGIFLDTKYNWNTTACENVMALKNMITRRNKSVLTTFLHDSVYIKCPEQANL